MNIKNQFGLLALIALSFLFSCSPKIKYGMSQPAYEIPCQFPVNFRMGVECQPCKVVSLTGGYVLVNGTKIPLQSPTGGRWGDYRFSGDAGSVPHDGNLRFRYAFRYTSGLPTNTTGDRVIYYPKDEYILRSIGKIQWDANKAATIPASLTDVNYVPLNTMSKILMLEGIFHPGFNGLMETQDIVTIFNDYDYPITLKSLEILDRNDDSVITDVSVSGINFPHQINANDKLEFVVRFEKEIEDGQSFVRDAKLVFEVNDSTRDNCEFTLWVDGVFIRNPG